MKKLLVATVITMASMNLNVASAASNNVGCGLGSMLFAGKSGLVSEVLAATTNGSSGNQTFGISSGSLGCKKDGVVTYTAALSTFMASNIDKVSHDMAVGKGESLETMANLMSIAEQDKASFYQASRDNFDVIFTSENITVKDVLGNLDKVMANNSTLAQYAS